MAANAMAFRSTAISSFLNCARDITFQGEMHNEIRYAYMWSIWCWSYLIITQLIRISIDCFISVGVDRSGKMSLHINMQSAAFLLLCLVCIVHVSNALPLRHII